MQSVLVLPACAIPRPGGEWARYRHNGTSMALIRTPCFKKYPLATHCAHVNE